MRGSIQFVASLVALLLIVTNGLLWVTRRADAGPRSVVVEKLYSNGRRELFWLIPGTNFSRPFPLTRSCYLDVQHQSRDRA